MLLCNKSSCEGVFLLIGSCLYIQLPSCVAFKGDDSCLLTNYRPVSVLSLLAKVFEN